MKLTKEQKTVIQYLARCIKAEQVINEIPNIEKAFNYKFMPEPVRECEIDGIRQPYDFCSKGDLDKAKDFYFNVGVYIGSGVRCWYDGKPTKWTTLHHFFKAVKL